MTAMFQNRVTTRGASVATRLFIPTAVLLLIIATFLGLLFRPRQSTTPATLRVVQIQDGMVELVLTGDDRAYWYPGDTGIIYNVFWRNPETTSIVNGQGGFGLGGFDGNIKWSRLQDSARATVPFVENQTSLQYGVILRDRRNKPMEIWSSIIRPN